MDGLNAKDTIISLSRLPPQKMAPSCQTIPQSQLGE
jgi:hypothetical protein